MILVYDTETSGLVKKDLDPLDPSQPALVQLGAHLFDPAWKRVGHLRVLIKPEGWEMEPGALAVHGITTAACQRYGVRLASALLLFMDLVAPATRIVAHNAQFDRRIITSALHRAGGSGTWWTRKASAMFCTMEAATAPCGLVGEFGPMFPSLEAAAAILCPAAPKPRHDADSDIEATTAVYRELVRRGVAKDPDAFPAVA